MAVMTTMDMTRLWGDGVEESGLGRMPAGWQREGAGKVG